MSIRPAAVRKNSLPPADGTRERLLATALQLFAREGLNGVSLRRIVLDAGAANPSALHYHFGSRQAVVVALAESLFARLAGHSLPQLQALADRPHDVRDILVALFQPFIELRGSGDAGRHALQFMARLSWEFGTEGQALSARGLEPLATEALGLLQAQLPGKPPDHLRLQLLMAMTNVFHGLADLNYLRVATFGPRGLLGPKDAALRIALMFDYLEAGLRSGRPPPG